MADEKPAQQSAQPPPAKPPPSAPGKTPGPKPEQPKKAPGFYKTSDADRPSPPVNPPTKKTGNQQ